uniref:Uncharacterized protein n=1 Tax=Rhizophora mucronata TaxID=61149 RepID=A0A2P2Q863_RHIMU
MVPFTESSSQE